MYINYECSVAGMCKYLWWYYSLLDLFLVYAFLLCVVEFFCVFVFPSEFQLSVHPHWWRLHTQGNCEPRLLLCGCQESCGWDQGPPRGIWQRGAAQNLQVRFDLSWGNVIHPHDGQQKYLMCVVSRSEWSPSLYYRESNTGKKEQRWERLMLEATHKATASQSLRLKRKGRNILSMCVGVCSSHWPEAVFVHLQPKKWQWTTLLPQSQGAEQILWNVSIKCIYGTYDSLTPNTFQLPNDC